MEPSLTPRAEQLHLECVDALSAMSGQQTVRKLDLEALTFAVGMFVKDGIEIDPNGERLIRMRLERITGKRPEYVNSPSDDYRANL